MHHSGSSIDDRTVHGAAEMNLVRLAITELRRGVPVKIRQFRRVTVELRPSIERRRLCQLIERQSRNPEAEVPVGREWSRLVLTVG